MNPEDLKQESFATHSQPIAATTPPVKIGKFKASKMIVKESWAVLTKDKELAWFPVLSSISILVALAVMGGLFFLVAMSGKLDAFENANQHIMNVIGYGILFAYYLVTFLITNYFLAGMYTIINARFNNQDLTFNDGIRGANNNLMKIFYWSLISATVGVILQFIADRSKIVAKIVAGILGSAWSIMTYFSLPSLIVGQTSVKESFKESASIIRKTWGETIIIHFGVGLFFTLLLFVGIILGVGMIVLFPIAEVMIAVVILFVLYTIALSIISSTLSSIFKLALYQYARTGTMPQGFTPALVQSAVQKGK